MFSDLRNPRVTIYAYGALGIPGGIEPLTSWVTTRNASHYTTACLGALTRIELAYFGPQPNVLPLNYNALVTPIGFEPM